MKRKTPTRKRNATKQQLSALRRCATGNEGSISSYHLKALVRKGYLTKRGFISSGHYLTESGKKLLIEAGLLPGPYIPPAKAQPQSPARGLRLYYG
jgi:hypothetical protein